MTKQAHEEGDEGLELITTAIKRDDAPTSVPTSYARMLDELGHGRKPTWQSVARRPPRCKTLR